MAGFHDPLCFLEHAVFLLHLKQVLAQRESVASHSTGQHLHSRSRRLVNTLPLYSV